MFNNSLKNQALYIHENTVEQYNASYKKMTSSCEQLYSARVSAIACIEIITEVINSIASKPKEFETTMGKVISNLQTFRETKEYAQKAYSASVKSGVSAASGVAAGAGIATMAPTAMMSIATTFGTASTGTAISALSGAVAQKAAVAWIGRTFASFAVAEGTAGMAAGNAFLALAGPIGWGIAAASTGLSAISLSRKNKKISQDAVEEAKTMAKAREQLDELTVKINALKDKTIVLTNDLNMQNTKMSALKGSCFPALSEADKLYLGSLVNNTFSLSVLITQKVE